MRLYSKGSLFSFLGILCLTSGCGSYSSNDFFTARSVPATSDNKKSAENPAATQPNSEVKPATPTQEEIDLENALSAKTSSKFFGSFSFLNKLEDGQSQIILLSGKYSGEDVFDELLSSFYFTSRRIGSPLPEYKGYHLEAALTDAMGLRDKNANLKQVFENYKFFESDLLDRENKPLLLKSIAVELSLVLDPAEQSAAAKTKLPAPTLSPDGKTPSTKPSTMEKNPSTQNHASQGKYDLHGLNAAYEAALDLPDPDDSTKPLYSSELDALKRVFIELKQFNCVRVIERYQTTLKTVPAATQPTTTPTTAPSSLSEGGSPGMGRQMKMPE